MEKGDYFPISSFNELIVVVFVHIIIFACLIVVIDSSKVVQND